MNKKLAIRGHLRRGVEVIKILEMLGGKISKECGYKDGYDSSYVFFINTDENFYIDGLFLCNCNNEELKKYYIFTFEEFIKKFPYKIGDKVQHNGTTSCGSVYVIEQMKWEDNQVKYVICDLYWKNCKCTVISKDLQPYKEETMERKDYNPITLIPVLDKVLIIPTDEESEIVQENNKFYLVKKQPQYPKTYEECCEVLDFDPDRQTVTGYDAELIENFQTLKLCRDAYWKIAGEQMGLDEPWEPDWTDSNFKYCLKKMGDNIEKSSEMTISCILAFPTEEIRDIFYNIFKNTIEQCKELL